ncbi:protein-tyrosine phosphatase family protein, partial [Salmonella sp. s54836]|uniref:protein-tyrosine phosphatase family protein n=1 Tax=Salmonella sp. s54836 TaxID=3159673 RepID=UPI0039803376
LKIQSNNLTREINHFHFLAWPDHDVPDQYEQLLDFVTKVRNEKIKDDAEITYGAVIVLLENELVYNGFVHRRLKIQSNNLTREINHFHFLAWPDHDVPDQYEQLLDFVTKVR